MGILGGEGFSLPVVSDTEVVDVKLNFSDAAVNALKHSMNGDEDSHVLIISAQSGGCSGYMYDMKIVEDPGDDGFQRLNIGGIGVLIHNKDSSMLSGITVDFKDTLMGGGFEINNPNADRSCGCGQSFG
ncbi:MAG: iron-sulfur cluster assembly accessory protein [Euryarchaeota archaeon]|nr:iron-sulfur cluster assembly accessory protein [Euryarchaeota archaeon]